MSKEETLLELVLDKFSNIKEVLNATKDIENFLIKLKLNKKRGLGGILEKTKNLIDSLYDHSVKVKEEFYNEYNVLEGLIAEKNNDDCENSVEEYTSINTKSNEIINNEDESQTQDISNVSIEERIEPGVENEEDKLGADKNEDKEADTEGENHLNNLEEDPLKGPESPSIIESSILEDNEDKENSSNEKEFTIKNETNEENKQNCKSLIRLVDLSKLIDPNQKKSVKFDSSIIILTSSDEEIQTPKKPTNLKNDTGNLKSALKNSLTGSLYSTTLENDNKVNGNGSKNQKHVLLKEKRSRSNSESDSEGSGSDPKVLQKEKDEGEVECVKTSSEASSDSNIEEVQQEKATETMKNRKTSGKSLHNSESESEELSDNGSDFTSKEKHLRKSSRIKTKEISKQTKKENLRKIFNRRLARRGISDSENKKKLRRDSSSDSESASVTKRKPLKKVELTEKHLSDTSSLSSSEIDSGTIRNKIKKNRSIRRTNDSRQNIQMDVDKQFKYEVYIPLSRIESKRLQEIYLKNKEIFEIKR